MFFFLNRLGFRQNLIGTIIRVLVRNIRAQSAIGNHERDQQVSVQSEPSVHKIFVFSLCNPNVYQNFFSKLRLNFNLYFTLLGKLKVASISSKREKERERTLVWLPRGISWGLTKHITSPKFNCWLRGTPPKKNSIFKDIIQIEVDLPPSLLDNVFKYTVFFFGDYPLVV